MATEAIDDRREKAALNQSLFRSVNEKLNQWAFDAETLHEFVCECAQTDCDTRLSLTAEEYEAVRRVPTHFLIAAGHDLPDVERVVEKKDRYVVVEKYGRGGSIAVRLDPRRERGPRLET